MVAALARLWQAIGAMPKPVTGVILIVAIALATATGCSSKAYPGPELPPEELVVVRAGARSLPEPGYVAIVAVDGQSSIEGWSAARNSSEVFLLPGKHDIEVQFQDPSASPGLLVMADDALRAKRTRKILRIQTRAGYVYSLHYRPNYRMFSVGEAKPVPNTEKVPLEPPANSTECDPPGTDQSEPLCTLILQP